MRPHALLGLAATALAGCGNSYPEFSRTTLGDAPTLVTTADVRVVTERMGPLDRPVTCVEPPPDVAKAVALALKASADATVTGGGNGSLTVAGNRGEQLAQLTGRVPGLLALRDGLFRACEAYGNGIVGPSAYALTLSRYGELLATVILGDAIQDPSQGTSITLPGEKPAPPDKAGQNALLGPLPGNGLAPAAWLADANEAAAPSLARTIADEPPKPAADKKKDGADVANVGAATALREMQANYFNLTTVGPLMVACIEEHDPGRPRLKSNPGSSPLLTPEFCRWFLTRLVDLELFGRENGLRIAAAKANVKAPIMPVRPPPAFGP